MGQEEIYYDLQRRHKGEWHDVVGFVSFRSVSELVRFVIQAELNPQEFPETRVEKNTIIKTATQEVI